MGPSVSLSSSLPAERQGGAFRRVIHAGHWVRNPPSCWSSPSCPFLLSRFSVSLTQAENETEIPQGVGRIRLRSYSRDVVTFCWYSAALACTWVHHHVPLIHPLQRLAESLSRTSRLVSTALGAGAEVVAPPSRAQSNTLFDMDVLRLSAEVGGALRNLVRRAGNGMLERIARKG